MSTEHHEYKEFSIEQGIATVEWNPAPPVTYIKTF